ncbi:LPXTG cell wall anchor domain-containing protein [Aeromicrobium sp. 9AM]|uniref:LPXTG cell wall anchor domain-containing protein n=1 Tax=Aeromicrobium sp. 9AM TaxID=2653126 RepID=UPI0012F40865|nr:LPXTG cell wall anchor domain-containing protein [Aeromicrobium sp. 9AM]VXB48807.1 exported hypothetical protein [Aeromicrobium sp. 9AM]
MRRASRALLSCGLIIGVLTFGVIGANSASAYPDQACQISVNKQVVHPGDSLRVTGEFVASPDEGLPVHWRVSFNKAVVRKDGSTFSHTFAIPTVQKRTVLRLQASATNGKVTCDPSVDIQVVPRGSNSDSPDASLPDTGAPSPLVAILGLLCLAVGATALRLGRRHPAVPGANAPDHAQGH